MSASISPARPGRCRRSRAARLCYLSQGLRSSSAVWVTSVSSGRSSVIEMTRLSMPRRSRSRSKSFRAASSRPRFPALGLGIDVGEQFGQRFEFDEAVKGESDGVAVFHDCRGGSDQRLQGDLLGLQGWEQSDCDNERMQGETGRARRVFGRDFISFRSVLTAGERQTSAAKAAARSVLAARVNFVPFPVLLVRREALFCQRLSIMGLIPILDCLRAAIRR